MARYTYTYIQNGYSYTNNNVGQIKTMHEVCDPKYVKSGDIGTYAI